MVWYIMWCLFFCLFTYTKYMYRSMITKLLLIFLPSNYLWSNQVLVYSMDVFFILIIILCPILSLCVSLSPCLSVCLSPSLSHTLTLSLFPSVSVSLSLSVSLSHTHTHTLSLSLSLSLFTLYESYFAMSWLHFVFMDGCHGSDSGIRIRFKVLKTTLHQQIKAKFLKNYRQPGINYDPIGAALKCNSRRCQCCLYLDEKSHFGND